jgi:hypothetical protein
LKLSGTAHPQRPLKPLPRSGWHCEASYTDSRLGIEVANILLQPASTKSNEAPPNYSTA